MAPPTEDGRQLLRAAEERHPVAAPDNVRATAKGGNHEQECRVMKVSIVTPSLNQARHLDAALASVSSQTGPFELEHFVVDGGSSDGTVDILRRHGGALRWVSEPDRGQSDAINKGFRLTSGEILGWLNADDTYQPGAIRAAVEAMAAGARWCFGQCKIIDDQDQVIYGWIASYKNRRSRAFSLTRLLEGNFIAQPAVFFRRELFEEVGPLEESCRYAMDYDLWLRFAQVAEPVFVPRDLASFRWHTGSKTASHPTASASEAFHLARRHARGRNKLRLLRHLLHAAAMTTGYGLIDRWSALRSMLVTWADPAGP